MGKKIRRPRVLLLYPPSLDPRIQEDDIRPIPMGLYYVGALLRHRGYPVEILNWWDVHKHPGRVEAELRKRRPDILGFSVLHANRWGAIDIARAAKALNPGVHVVFGGIGATFLWEHLLAHFPEIDAVVLGEGEYPFLKIVRHIGQDDVEGFGDIRGIAFRESGRPVRTQAADPVEDIDELPMPGEYFTFQHVASSRGCPWNCAFCGSPAFWGRRVRFHSPTYFVRQLEFLRRKGIRFFYVSDDTFTLRRDRVIEICRLILDRGLDISWVAISRVNAVDEEVLCWMRRAGCIQISYGVESGSEEIRKALNKNIRTDDIRRAFALTVSCGILPRAYFIYGSPGESEQTVQASLDLMDEIRPLAAIFYILDLFPGTRLYEEYRERAGVGDDIWLDRIEDIPYFETDPGLTEEQVLAAGRRLRGHFYGNLHRYADSLELSSREDLAGLHSDFCSRLGLTFSHGDYASAPGVVDPQGVAERLFRRALAYAPDQRAYLGLGILAQKRGEDRAAVEILTEGVRRFPQAEGLNVCLGMSYMNLGLFQDALVSLLPFPHVRQAVSCIVQCCRALGDREREEAFIRRLREME